MQLIEDEKFEITCGSDKFLLGSTGKQQFEHHIVGEKNVRRIRDDSTPLFYPLLTGVPRVCDRRLILQISALQILLELIEL